MTHALGSLRHRQKVAKETGRLMKMPTRRCRPEVTPDGVRVWETKPERRGAFRTGWWRYIKFKRKRITATMRKILSEMDGRGWMRVTQIAKLARIPRTTCSYTLKRLNELDIVEYYTLAGKRITKVWRIINEADKAILCNRASSQRERHTEEHREVRQDVL